MYVCMYVAAHFTVAWSVRLYVVCHNGFRQNEMPLATDKAIWHPDSVTAKWGRGFDPQIFPGAAV